MARYRSPWTLTRGKSAAVGIILSACLTWSAAASTVPPYSFGRLVDEANLIFTGEVVRVESRWVTNNAGRAIATTVTFRIERLLKGEAARQVALEFLGGQVGDVGLEIAGVPRFAVGDRAVMCVDITRPLVSPVVGVNQGRFPVHRQPETGLEYVTMFDGGALSGVEMLGQPRVMVSPRPVGTLTREELELEILREVRASRR